MKDRISKRQTVKQQLREAFEAPSPEGRDLFLEDCPVPSISTFSLIIAQAGYIRKRIWVFSLCIFVLALYKSHRMERDTLWMLSALAPFVAMTLLSENARSKAYGMAELEMSCRFFRKSILLARMGCLALSHLLLMGLLTPLAYFCSGTSILQTGVYLLVPYLLTLVLGLGIMRRVPDRESLAACACIAVAISCLFLSFRYCFLSVWDPAHWNSWLAIFFLLLLLLLREIRKMIRQMEEPRWNLS